ncbi:MAG: twin-arginine translocase TatA/TatE family subunit [Cellulomonas sp.]|jgi:sec-independent protein translocase protein TatA|nr:twin-arginine translocase TatA/TatE family subunit [Cellulomonas sp.]
MGRFFENPVVLIVLILVLVIVFGANKLPVAAKSLGQSLRIFKNEVRPDEPKAAPATATAPLADETSEETTRRSQSDQPPSGDDRT